MNGIRNSIISSVALLLISFFFKKIRIFLFSDMVIPMWIFIGLVLLSLVSILIGILKIKSPKHRSYKEENIDRIVWRWRYNILNEIFDMKPFCPTDNTQLIFRYLGLNRLQIMIDCETCRKTFGPFDGDISYLINRIKRQIERRIRNKEY